MVDCCYSYSRRHRMKTSADYAVVIDKNIGIIVLASLVVLVGSVSFWQLNSPDDAVAFFGALLGSTVILGVVLGYRSQKLGTVRLWSVAYPVSWRVGCVWLVQCAMVESVLTDGTISYTVHFLSPVILVFTGVTAASVVGGWLVRQIAVGITTLTRGEWIALIGLVVAIAGLIVALRVGGGRLPPKPEESSDSSVSVPSGTGPQGERQS